MCDGMEWSTGEVKECKTLLKRVSPRDLQGIQRKGNIKIIFVLHTIGLFWPCAGIGVSCYLKRTQGLSITHCCQVREDIKLLAMRLYV